MPGILDNFEVGKRSLIAQQAVMNTVGHNLANATTPGYSRQRVELVTMQTRNGVEVATIHRIRDRYLDFSLMTENQALGQYQAQQGLLQRLEAVFNDPPGAGLASALDGFFLAFSDLSLRPADPALRLAVQERGAQLASTLQGMYGRIDQLKRDLGTEIQEHVTAANGLLGQIAELEERILANGPNPPPNDLLDKRDQLVSQLNQLIGVRAMDRPDGTIQLAVAGSGVLLLDGGIVAPLTAAYDPVADRVDLSVGSIVVTPSGGELSGVLTARNSPTGPVKQAAADLDELARGIIAEVNRVHANGAGLAGHAALTAVNAASSAAVPLSVAGLPFAPGSGSFTVIVHDAAGAVKSTVTVSVTAGTTTLADVAAAIDASPDLSASVSGGTLSLAAGAGDTFVFAGDTSDTLMALGLNTFFSGSGARDIALDPLVAADAGKIAAARPTAAGLVHPGDGQNALALAQLRDKTALAGGTASFSGFLASVTSRVGAETREAHDAVERQQSVVNVVQALQQQTSAVSTDEEMIALSQAQDVYAAAARYISTVQEMVQTLLDMVAV